MSKKDRIDSLENEIEFIKEKVFWMPEKLLDAYRRIQVLSDRIAALEEKLRISESGTSSSN